MFGLEKFLEVFKDSKVLIPTLIAVILVGALGGGIWINNLNNEISSLNNTISLQKGLSDDKLALIAEGNASVVKRLNSRFEDFEYEFNRIKRDIDRTYDSINQSINILEQITAKGNDSTLKLNINNELIRIRNQYKYYSNKLSDLDSQLLQSKEDRRIVLASKQMEVREIKEPSKNWVVLIVGIILLLVIVMWGIIKLRNKISKTNKASNSATDSSDAL